MTTLIKQYGLGFIIAHNKGTLKETQSTYFMLLKVTQSDQENVENDDNSVEKATRHYQSRKTLSG